MSVQVDLRIYSPRWGHDDNYSVELTHDQMTITMQARVAQAKWVANLDPEWSGESLQDIMRNDSIYPPAVTQRLFEYLWLTWRAGEIDDASASDELQEIAAWINAVTHAKPGTEFWRKFF